VPSSSQRPDLHPRLPALSLRESDGAFRTDCRNSSRRARKPTSHAGCLVRQIPLTAVFQKLLCNQPGILAQCLLHLAGELGVVAEELLGILAPLAEALRIIGEPCTGFLDDSGLDAKIDQLAGLGHAFAIHDV